MGALIPILLQAVPEVASWIFGDKTGNAVQKAADIAKKVLGTDDPAQVEATIQGDPAKTLELRMALLKAKSESEQRSHDEIMARIGDVANARAQTVSLSSGHSAIAWGAPIISTLVLAMFGWTLYIVLVSKIPPGQELTIGTMLGALTTMATAVVGYWVGSTAGSLQKTQIMGQQAQHPAVAVSTSTAKS